MANIQGGNSAAGAMIGFLTVQCKKTDMHDIISLPLPAAVDWYDWKG